MSETPAADGRLSAERPPGRVVACLVGILVVALAIRVCLLLTATMTSRDTATFVWYAQDLGADPVAAIRGHDQHPLYPAMILAVRHTAGRLVPADGVREWAVSAQIAACTSGLAAVVGVYLLAAQLFTRRVGVIAALLMALLSEACQLSADGLSDMPHLALYLFAAASLVAGFRRGSPLFCVGAGALSGLAFLTRPEGAAAAVVGLAGGCVLRTSSPTRRRIVCGVLCAAVFFAVAAPYMASTGRIVRKKSLRQLFHLADTRTGVLRGECVENVPPREHTQESDQPGVHTAAPSGFGFDVAAWEIVYKYFRAGRVLFVLPMLVGLAAPQVPRAEASGRRLVQMLAGVHVLLLFALGTAYGYVAMRHVLLLVVLTLPFSAAALAAFVDALVAQLSVKVAQPAAVVRRNVWIILLVVLVGGTGYWTFRPLHAGRGYVRQAGSWIREAGFSPDTMIITTRHRVAFHAGCRASIPPDTGRIEDLMGLINQATERVAAGHAALLVVEDRHITSDKRNPRFFEELTTSLIDPGRLETLHVEPATAGESPCHIHIYRVKAPARS